MHSHRIRFERLEARLCLAADFAIDLTSPQPAEGTAGAEVSYSISIANESGSSRIAEVMHLESELQGITWERESPRQPVLDIGQLDGPNGFRIDIPVFEGLLGWSIDEAGDVNGDGIDDVVIGVPGQRIQRADADDPIVIVGAVYVVFGSTDHGELLTDAFDQRNRLNLATMPDSAGFEILGFDKELSGIVFEEIGNSVSGAGDVNGDGYADILIGSPTADPAGLFAGETYLIYGSEQPVDVVLNELDGTNGFTIFGEATSDRLGSSVAKVGDLNGDGIDDMLIGAPGFDRMKGAAYVVFGSPEFAHQVNLTDLDGENGYRIMGWRGQQNIGSHVSSAGDVNGDGLVDLIIAGRKRPSFDGLKYLLFGTGGPFEDVDLETIASSQGFIVSESASRVRGSGDLDGDGLAEIATAFRPDPSPDRVVYGTPNLSTASLEDLNGNNGFLTTTDLLFESSAWAMEFVDDINGDGLDELILGRPYITTDTSKFRSNQGIAHVLYGRERGSPLIILNELDGSDGFTIEGNESGAAFGTEVSGAGDFNNDGIGDLLLSAILEDSNNFVDEGAAYIVFGREDFKAGNGPLMDTLVLDAGESVTYHVSGVIPEDASTDFIEDLIVTDADDPLDIGSSLEVPVVVGPSSLPGDVDNDGTVSFSDFLILASNFGKENASSDEGDIDGNGVIEFADFLILSQNFGLAL